MLAKARAAVTPQPTRSQVVAAARCSGHFPNRGLCGDFIPGRPQLECSSQIEIGPQTEISPQVVISSLFDRHQVLLDSAAIRVQFRIEWSPGARSKIADLRSQGANPRSLIPDRGSQISDLRSQIPDRGSQSPDRRSEIATPRSRIPDLSSQIADPRSQIPDLRSQTADPKRAG